MILMIIVDGLVSISFHAYYPKNSIIPVIIYMSNIDSDTNIYHMINKLDNG